MGSCKFPCTSADRTRQCRGGACPSRRNAADTNGLPLKRYALPNCHCEGALRPWQSRAGSHDFADSFPTIQLGTARFPRRFAPRNDKFGSRCGRRECLQICDCLRRSGSAATDAIGACHFIDTLNESPTRRRARLSAPLQRTTVGPAKFPSRGSILPSCGI